MDKLTIIFLAKSDYIEKNIRLLKPIYESELEISTIIINNEEELKINYIYRKYMYNQEYSKFHDFCKNISISNNILILEEGLELCQEHLDILKKLLKTDKRNVFFKTKKI